MTTPETYNRRTAIKRISAMFGGATLIGGTVLLEGCDSYDPDASYSGSLFTAQDIALLDEIADTILPDTDTPGAKAAEVGKFVAMMVTDTYYPDDQATFVDGLAAWQAEAMADYGSSFLELSPENRLELVNRWDREQFDAGDNDDNRHPFRMMKQLTLLGYFTSEIGCTQALRYMETPGRYDPCVILQPGDTIVADHA